jgi:hypothetical protein
MTGAESSGIADLLDKVFELKTFDDKLLASEEALSRRIDRISAGPPHTEHRPG